MTHAEFVTKWRPRLEHAKAHAPGLDALLQELLEDIAVPQEPPVILASLAPEGGR